MKKLFTLIAATMLCVGAQAQTVNIHLKNGKSIYYSGNEVEYVDFDEEMALGGTAIASHKIGKLEWQEANLGADKPWEPGGYFLWCVDQGYSLDNNSSQDANQTDFNQDFYNGLTKVSASNWNPKVTIGGKTHSKPSGWRVPTNDDFQNLISSSKRIHWDTYPMTNVTGIWFVYTENDSIFFPAAGYFCDDKYELGRFGSYWSSDTSQPNQIQVPNADNGVVDSYAQGLFFGSDAYSSEGDIKAGNFYWKFFQAQKKWYALPIRLCKNK